MRAPRRCGSALVAGMVRHGASPALYATDHARTDSRAVKDHIASAAAMHRPLTRPTLWMVQQEQLRISALLQDDAMTAVQRVQ